MRKWPLRFVGDDDPRRQSRMKRKFAGGDKTKVTSLGTKEGIEEVEQALEIESTVKIGK